LQNPELTVFETIRMLLRRKKIDAEVRAESVISDLGLESLDAAELSAISEDDLGRDPYSAGFLPETVGQIITWYKT
jgi:acyl carrier protein